MSVEIIHPSETAWNPEKVRIFREQYEEFRYYFKINSKDLGGDSVLGDHTFVSQKMLLDGIFDALSEDIHDIKILKSRQLGCCYDPSMRVLTEDLRWVTVEDLTVGTRLVAVEENKPKGHGKGRKMLTAVVEAKWDVFEEAFELEMDNGVKLLVTGKHRHLTKRKWGTGNFSTDTFWQRVEDMRVGDVIRRICHPWEESRSYEDGWAGGMADGEGHISGLYRSGCELNIAQVAGPVLERFRAYLVKEGYNFHEEIDSRKGGEKSKLGSKPVHKLCIGRMDEIFRFIGKTRATRFLARKFWEQRSLPGKATKDSIAWGEIKSIRALGKRRMIDIQTSEKTYICEGYVSHNSTETRCLSLFWNGVHDGLKGAMVYDSDPNKEAARQDLVYAINELPAKLKFPKVKSDNRYGLTLSNNSTVVFRAAGTRANRSGGGLGRSVGVNFAHCSEMCQWENTEGVISFQQSLSEVFPNRLYIWESTARGPGLWNDLWDTACKDYSNQKAIFLGWWSKDTQRLKRDSRAFHQYGLTPPSAEEQKKIDEVFSLYGVKVDQEQLAWYRKKMDPAGDAEDDIKDQAEGDDFRRQEQPWTANECFIAAGSTFFSPDRLAEIRGKDTSNKYKPFRYYPGTDFVTCRVEPARNWRETQLKVWEEPVDDAVYVISCDPAFGHDESNDRSCIEVCRAYADCLEQVAEFSDPLTPTNHLAWIIWSLIGWYGGGQSGSATNAVHTIIELNGPGDAVWIEFKNVVNIVKNGYLRMEAREKGLINIFNNVRNFVYTRSDSMSIGSALHWKTTSPLKISIMERLRGYSLDNSIIIRSQDALDEMKQVTRNGDDIRAEGRRKDDKVMSLAMACRAWDDRARKALIAQNRTKRADAARRQASRQDLYQAFTQNHLSDFFKTKARARIKERALHRRMGWRGRP